MEYIEAIKIKRRMLNATFEKRCDAQCAQCNFTKNNTGINMGCGEFELFYPEEAEEILIKWDEMNPIITYLSVFLDAFPNAELDEQGIPTEICPSYLGLEARCNFAATIISGNPCPSCWVREVVPYEK